MASIRKFKWYSIDYPREDEILPVDVSKRMQKYALKRNFTEPLDEYMVYNASLALREQLKSRLAYDYKAQVVFNTDGSITVDIPLHEIDELDDGSRYVLTKRGIEKDDLDDPQALTPSEIKDYIEHLLKDSVYVALMYSTVGIIDAMNQK